MQLQKSLLAHILTMLTPCTRRASLESEQHRSKGNTMKYYDVQVRITILAESDDDADQRVTDKLFTSNLNGTWSVGSVTETDLVLD